MVWKDLGGFNGSRMVWTRLPDVQGSGRVQEDLDRPGECAFVSEGPGVSG